MLGAFSDFGPNLRSYLLGLHDDKLLGLPSTAINDKTAAREAKPSASNVIIFDAMEQEVRAAFRPQRKSI
jgi:hypothetical protein